ncbi:MAG TPA: thiamine-binding protein [Acidimicrobiales bacterium]|nr:thiamine-binding protein [Acidimicrobiales bacterium]
MAVQLEFTVEPFDPGAPGPHVKAAEEAARAAGGEVAVGPFGTVVTGGLDEVSEAVGSVVRAAMAAGAVRVTLQVSAGDGTGG